MTKRIDLTGQTFGRLKVIELSHIHDQCIWLCVCNCGNMTRVEGRSLRKGITQSCGCYHREVAAKVCVFNGIIHGMSKSREYNSYMSAKNRCTNPNSQGYKDYGGRGIKFLFEDFEEFYDHIGPRPIGHILDRTANNGHYDFGNVRWVTPKLSVSNRRPKGTNKTGCKRMPNGGSYGRVFEAPISTGC